MGQEDLVAALVRLSQGLADIRCRETDPPDIIGPQGIPVVLHSHGQAVELYKASSAGDGEPVIFQNNDAQVLQPFFQAAKARRGKGLLVIAWDIVHRPVSHKPGGQVRKACKGGTVVIRHIPGHGDDVGLCLADSVDQKFIVFPENSPVEV